MGAEFVFLRLKMSNLMTHPQSSSRNPFRAPFLTPNPTGGSVVSSAPSYHTALPFSHTLLTPTPTGMSTVSTAPSYQTAVEADARSDYEEAQGALLELTPRIPFRNPPNQLLSSLPPHSNYTGSSQSTPPSIPSALTRPSFVTAPPPPPSSPPDDLLSDDIPESAPPPYSLTSEFGDSEATAEEGLRRSLQSTPEPPPQPALEPPPLSAPEPSVQPPPPDPSPEPPLTQMSDFARDFYRTSAEPSSPPSPPPPTPPLNQQRRYAPPPGPPPSAAPVLQQPRHVSPPGAPPPIGRPSAASTSSGAGSTLSPPRDGHPTTTPTPGRPLLRNGRTLLYPESYYCPKCSNTGYKNFDPSHPCRKCWDRFGKPFSSILASSPWGNHGSGASGQSQQGRTFQHPLPALKTPQVGAAPVYPRLPPPPPAGFVPPRPPPPPPLPPPPPRVGPAVTPYGAIPPPGAAVVMPGDWRIGGRLCWRCDGRGTTSFLIFDEMTCETCGGVGRLLNAQPPHQTGCYKPRF